MMAIMTFLLVRLLFLLSTPSFSVHTPSTATAADRVRLASAAPDAFTIVYAALLAAFGLGALS
jgi:hypothetical protein